MAAKSDRDHVPIQFSSFSFSFRERWNAFRALKKQKNENNTTLFHRRQNEEDDKEDDKEEVDATAVPWAECVEKKEELYYSPDAFSPKNSHEISQRRSKNIFARTNRKRPKTRERERKSFLFYAFSYSQCLLFLHTHYFTRAFTLTLLFKYTHTFIKKCCSLPRRTSLNRFYYGGASFCSATVGDDDPAERVAS